MTPATAAPQPVGSRAPAGPVPPGAATHGDPATRPAAASPSDPAATPLTDRRRRLFGLAVLAGLLALVVIASLAIGANPLTPGEVWHALTSPTGTEGDVVVRSLRVPRTLLGLVVGVALGVAGVLIQGHTRNPLADPGLLGVSAGAALAVVAAIFVLGAATLYGYVWFAFAGALVASLVVFGFGSLGRGGGAPVTLALAGVAVTALLNAATSALVLLDTPTLDAYRFWSVGGLAGREARITGQVLPFVLAGLVLAAANVAGLNALSLGEDVARALGTRILLTRVVGVAAITLLTGSAVAACGPIAFIGLVVPHLARGITGPDHRWLTPYAALLGAALLLAADVVGRVVAGDGELAAGIVLAVVGAPFFIAIVRRKGLTRI